MKRTRPVDRHVEKMFGVSALAAIALSDAKDHPAGWGHLISTGHYVNPVYGEFDLTLADLDTIVHNFHNVTPAQKELPVDYSHTSRDPKTIDQAKAAGWIKDVQVRSRDEARQFGELWAHTEFTPACAEMIRNKELKYYSAEWRPHFIHKTTGEDIGPALVSAAVTIRPFVEGLHAITLCDTATASGVPSTRAAIRLGDVSAILDPEDSIDDLREDLSQQVYERFGYGVWIKDIFMPEDGGCVVIERNGELFRIEWTDDETTDEPVLGTVLTSVKAAYVPGDTALSEDDTMKHTIKLSDGRSIVVDEAQILAAADTTGGAQNNRPAQRSGPSADTLALADTVNQLVGAVKTLVDRDVTREKGNQEATAKRRVADLVRERKLLKPQEAWATNYALSDPKGFEEYAATLVPLFKTTAHGTGEDGRAAGATHTAKDAITGESISATDADATQTGAEDEFQTRVNAYMSDHKLNPNKRDDLTKAMRAVAMADPDLETRRRAEMENAVIPFARGGVNRHTEVAAK